MEYLEDAKALGDSLIVGINSDESVKRLKGDKRPINNEEDRARVLLGLKSVDGVIVFNEDDPLKLVKKIKPDVIVKGGDWKIENIIGAKFVIDNGGEAYSLPFSNGYSTTNILKKLQDKM